MNTVIQILVAGIVLFIIWQSYKVIKANPSLLSRENMNKSFMTMGILALILIASVAAMVFLLRV